MTRKLIVIAGPTASGKTQLAVELAEKHQTEIISFDSRQFYKEMNIGTAKPGKVLLERVKHHFIGHLSVHDEYNAGQFEKDALEKMDELFLKKDTLVMVGGSGMYLDAVLYGFDELPQVEAKLREKLNELYQTEGLETLQIMLAKLDPEHYNNVDLKNPHRLIRALEVSISTGIPYSQQRKGKSKPRNFEAELFAVDFAREELYERINRRVDMMMEEGLLEEVKKLYPLKHLNALQTVGYKELFAYLDNKTDLETAVNLIKQNTRRFAKRQITWFKKYEEMTWMSADEILNQH